MIKDSGNRSEFETGAVRDIQEGKGRMDLLPMKQLGDFISYKFVAKNFAPVTNIFDAIDGFYRTRDVNYIYELIRQSETEFGDVGTMIMELSIHFEEGAKKYGDRNWERGIPLHCYVNSALRHYMKHFRGDSDERHDRAFIWNLFCLVATYENHPELDDLPKID